MNRFAMALFTAVVALFVSGAVYAGSNDSSAQRAPLNFRSLGGLPAAGGSIRDNAIYRSAMLTSLKEEEARPLRDLHLRTIIDLRTDPEVMFEGQDSPLVRRDVAYLRLPLMTAIFINPRYYQHMVTEEVDSKSIKRFFDTFADAASYPVLYHCAVGCDRTGAMTALLLELAGTPRNVIMQDYMASKTVKETWLSAVFAAVDRAGGIEPFLARHGVLPLEQAAIRTNLIARSTAQKS